MTWAELYPHWEPVRRQTLVFLRRLSPAPLTWTPQPGVSSIGEKLLHVAQVEDYWFRHHIEGQPLRPSYALADFPDMAAIQSLIDHVHADAERVLEPLAPDQLTQAVGPHGQKLRRSLGWIIWHVVEHEVYHRGQIMTLLRMQGLLPT